MNNFYKILFFFIAIANCAFADQINLEDEKIPIAKHLKQESGEKFKKHDNELLKQFLAESNFTKEQLSSAPSQIPPISYVFSLEIPNGAGAYDGKPNCESPQVRRIEVLYDSEELKFFDMLYYAYADSSQVAKAKNWDFPAVPYLEGDLQNPYRENSIQQSYARFFAIRCLPTRVHFPIINGQRYEEYREGERAWDKIIE